MSKRGHDKKKQTKRERKKQDLVNDDGRGAEALLKGAARSRELGRSIAKNLAIGALIGTGREVGAKVIDELLK